MNGFNYIRRCGGCGYWVFWRSEYSLCFPRKVEQQHGCPHCGGDWQVEDVNRRRMRIAKINIEQLAKEWRNVT